ncbi:MAG: trypsin-like peptidase domain-containing protein [Planctomycetaceae bacterium]|nr:trypsin-like peptidase domain-containing protein [Planctomycetaceae bacterium]
MPHNKQWIPVALFASVFAYAAIDGARLVQKFSFAATKGQTEALREQLGPMSKNDALSPLFAQISAAIKPAVVEVRVVKKVRIDSSPEMNEFLRHFFGDSGDDSSAQPKAREFLKRGLGNGVVVDAAKGYILTNYHLVAESDLIRVSLPDGRSLKVEWTRSDPQTDLAVIKVNAGNLIDAPLGDSDAIRVGNWVLAIGSPQGLNQTVTAGIISAKGRTTGETNTFQSFIQTDAAVNRGNSGGPLVNMRGEVVGINTAILTESGGSEGIGFAVPSNMARNIMRQLIDKGKVTRGFLGITVQEVSPSLAKSFSLPDIAGVLVTMTMPESPAARAGIKEGDFITALDGQPVTEPNDLRMMTAALTPGKKVDVEYYRDGKKNSVSLTPQEQPAATASPRPVRPQGAELAQFGLVVDTVTHELAMQYGYESIPRGVLITKVRPGSAADGHGLRAGMVITKVQDREIGTAEQLNSLISSAAQGVRLRIVSPSGGVTYTFLTPEGPSKS